MIATFPTTNREITKVEALRIYDGLTAWQYASIEEHVSPAVVAHAQAQRTRTSTALLIVAEAARLGLLAFDKDQEEA
jgi:hypothetical protein